MKAIIFDYNGVLNTGAEIKEVISKLAQEYQLFIASSSSEKSLKQELEVKGVLKYFTEIIGYDPGLTKFDKFKSILKDYFLDPKDVIFITDTQGDIAQAQQAGIDHNIGILGGWADKRSLARANPEVIIDDFRKLPKEIKEIFNT